MKKISDLTPPEVIKIMKDQRWLQENADIEYDRYYKKLSLADWWYLNHWKRIEEDILSAE